jgi:hypothetical protein
MSSTELASFSCLYTKHKKQKSKTWHDGVIKQFANRKVTLVGADGQHVESLFLQAPQSELTAGSSLEMETVLVEIDSRLDTELAPQQQQRVIPAAAPIAPPQHPTSARSVAVSNSKGFKAPRSSAVNAAAISMKTYVPASIPIMLPPQVVLDDGSPNADVGPCVEQSSREMTVMDPPRSSVPLPTQPQSSRLQRSMHDILQLFDTSTSSSTPSVPRSTGTTFPPAFAVDHQPVPPAALSSLSMNSNILARKIPTADMFAAKAAPVIRAQPSGRSFLGSLLFVLLCFSAFFLVLLLTRFSSVRMCAT